MGMDPATGMIIGSVVSGGMGMAASSKAAKAAGKAPPPRSYLGEMQGALRAQGAIMPELLQLQSAYNPAFQNLQKETLMGQIGTLRDVYGSAIPIGAQLAGQSTAAMAPVLSGIGSAAQQAYRSMLGPQAAGILDTMEGQAANELALGRSLSPQEEMMGQQAARAAMQARGLQGGNQAVASEVLNNYNLSMQREAQRRAYAGQVYGMSQNAAGNAYTMYGQPLTQMIAGFSPQGMYGQAQAASAEYAQKFNPESQYMSDVMGGNTQNAMNAQLASAQAKAGMGAGLMSLAGSIGGGLASNKGLFEKGSSGGVTQDWSSGTIAKQYGMGYDGTTGMITSF